MKKLMILLFLLVVTCAPAEPLDNARVYNPKVQIKSDLQFFLHKHKRHWSKHTIKRCVNILYKGQKEFKIDYKVVLAIISHESKFRIRARGKNGSSIDFGLTQQNSRYLKVRYKVSQKYLDKNHIAYGKSKYDIGKNIFSCYMFLNEIMNNKKIKYFDQVIKAYNVGAYGVHKKSMQNTAQKYYHKVYKEYIQI